MAFFRYRYEMESGKGEFDVEVGSSSEDIRLTGKYRVKIISG